MPPPVGAGASAATDAGGVLALRWAAAALSQPQHAPRLWPALPAVLDGALRLREAAGPYADVLQSALCGLRVEDSEERGRASWLLAHVVGRAFEALCAEAAGSTALSADAYSSAELLTSVLFGLLPLVKQPLLPELLAAARELVLGAPCDATRGRCCLWLRHGVSASAIGPRKQKLVAWLLDLAAELRQREAGGGGERRGAAGERGGGGATVGEAEDHAQPGSSLGPGASPL